MMDETERHSAFHALFAFNANLGRGIEMGSRIRRTSLKLCGRRGLASVAGYSLLLATQLTIAVGLGSAQIGPSEFVDANSQIQQAVSVNQLLTPYKAQRVLEKARQDFLHGRFDSALRDTERALHIFPRCAVAFSIQGAVNLSQRNYADAGRRFQQAIDAEPAFGPAYLGLGMAYSSQGRFNEALIPLNRSASFLPGSWIVYFELAFADLGLGEPAKALKEIASAERFTGTDPQKRAGVLYLRGIAHFEMKGYREAQAEFNETIERDRDGIFALLAKDRLKQLASVGDSPEIALSSTHNFF